MYGHFAEGPGLCIYGRFYVGIADNILQRSDYKKIRKNRYAFFDTGKGKEFVDGQLSLENLRNFAMENGEPSVKSGKQEYLENIINNFI